MGGCKGGGGGVGGCKERSGREWDREGVREEEGVRRGVRGRGGKGGGGGNVWEGVRRGGASGRG